MKDNLIQNVSERFTFILKSSLHLSIAEYIYIQARLSLSHDIGSEELQNLLISGSIFLVYVHIKNNLKLLDTQKLGWGLENTHK